ncbi:rna-directed dna polymerase from mobile element jockey- hypothetical protein [Limosa lapponica baueri]|uniref:Reverse transcriptase domain-containing protein n=1 Tax=Limosa lapponica baueri TaxID=1758121 RepID=A0A2I0UC54_LIMLA|nr:rna-directed dna polymerase from mobile element jockey- hypothetical protein [Limosa lapponica baueri]
MDLIRKTFSRDIKDKKIIKCSQHGFIREKTRLKNLISIYNEITALVDEGRAVDIAYLDFGKAFDTVSYKIFIGCWISRQRKRGNSILGCTRLQAEEDDPSLLRITEGKKPVAQQQLERGLRICKRNNSGDTTSEEGREGDDPGTGKKIPLPPVVKTIVRQAVPLQIMEVHSVADMHLQAMEDPRLE